MRWGFLLAVVTIVRVSHSPLGGPAKPGSSSSWVDGTEPMVSPRVHPNPDERLADLVDRKSGISMTAAGEELGLTPTAMQPIVARLQTAGRVTSRDGALYHCGPAPTARREPPT